MVGLGWLAIWLAGCPAGWLSGWLAGCLAGYQAGWLETAWLVPWLSGVMREGQRAVGSSNLL